MTLVVKLYLWLILLQRFPYLGVCFAHKMNHSFICEDSCEPVTEKKMWKTMPFLLSRPVIPKLKTKNLCVVLELLQGWTYLSVLQAWILTIGEFCVLLFQNSTHTRKRWGITECYEDQDRLCCIPFYAFKHSTDNSLVWEHI